MFSLPKTLIVLILVNLCCFKTSKSADDTYDNLLLHKKNSYIDHTYKFGGLGVLIMSNQLLSNSRLTLKFQFYMLKTLF